ncbi:phage major capsid protein [Thermoactinomyces sp. DSM 45892]|uniref:phage major capsid protein n=1 Tax=Thermoactinomyces sp. DSM 45892 TaxID=1882753 RepID=UPI000895BC89|nr:phage major capsid protein [Thermoactinomyces sp. DSM 45892]SDY22975.1 phage major capsid protein, HK97 family [Thermoactinomyces sp. DSM 45892]
MADMLKELLEGIKQNTAGLRSELDELKGKHPLEDPLVKEKLERYDQEFVELKKSYEEEKKAREQVELKLQRAKFLPGDPQNIINEEQNLQKKAFEKFIRYGVGESSKASWAPEEWKALSSLSDQDGGFLILPDFENEILKIAQDSAEVRPVANVGTTNRDRVQVGKITQRAVIGWGNENVAVDPQDLKFGLEDMPINEITALVLIPNSTLEDAGANIFSELSMIFGEDIAAEEDDQFMIGHGVGRPEGILSNTEVQSRYVASGVAGALTDASHNGVDALIQAQYKLKKIYRRSGTWAFNSSTESVIRQIKNGNGDYVWQPPVQAGAPATLLGNSIINPEGTPDIAANSYPILFGDFRRGYRIRDRKGMTIQRLVERYAEYRQTGFLITKRVGGQVVLPESFVPIKIATN